MYKIKRFFEKVLRIIDYLPILWNDEDWDYEYILPILRKKIDRIGKCIKNNKIITEHEEVYQETRDTIQAIDNFDNHLDLFIEIYGEDPETSILDNAEEYYINLYNFENDRWNEIWDTIKKNGRKWWD